MTRHESPDSPDSFDSFDPWDSWMAAQDAIPFPVYVVDTKTLKLLAVNTAMRKLSGGKIGGICHREIYHSEGPCLHCPLETMLARKDTRPKQVFELFNEANDRWYQLEETLIPWHDGRIAKYSIAVDVTALKEAQNALVEAHAELTLKSRQLERLAVTDQLTGLCNRRRLDETFLREVERAERFETALSVIVCDIDRFKEVNDTHGHQIGDKVLCLIAGLLRDGVRQVDTVGRWGGEEFAIICPETPLEGAHQLAEKLRLIVQNQKLPLVGHRTVSFGVASLHHGVETATSLLCRADHALYRAKDNGRNRVEVAEAPPAQPQPSPSPSAEA